MFDGQAPVNPAKTSAVHIVLAGRDKHILDKDGLIYFINEDGKMCRYHVTDRVVKLERKEQHNDNVTAWWRESTLATVTLYDHLRETGEMQETFNRLHDSRFLTNGE